MRKRKIYLDDIIKQHNDLDYSGLYSYIVSEIDCGRLVPVKASGVNGKKPALNNAYWIYEKDKGRDTEAAEHELLYRINPSIDVSYYLKHLENYERDYEAIQCINSYLSERNHMLSKAETVNERSFEIFGREKFLKEEGGEALLKHLGLSLERLNCYTTSEPMSYYSHHKKTPQNILIIENKDTFYSMRRHLIEGGDSILGLDAGTLVYGRGKDIHKTFEDYVNKVEPYFGGNNTIYYFGDLDYEGILIYENLVKRYEGTEIRLFIQAYQRMVEKAEDMGLGRMPYTKEGQNRNIGGIFMGQFPLKLREKMDRILREDRYIPQEILNEQDY